LFLLVALEVISSITTPTERAHPVQTATTRPGICNYFYVHTEPTTLPQSNREIPQRAIGMAESMWKSTPFGGDVVRQRSGSRRFSISQKSEVFVENARALQIVSDGKSRLPAGALQATHYFPSEVPVDGSLLFCCRLVRPYATSRTTYTPRINK